MRRHHRSRIPLEGSAELTAWFDPEIPNPDMPGDGPFVMALSSGGRELVPPTVLTEDVFDVLRGPVNDRDPEEVPFAVEVGPMTIRGWDLEFSVEFRGKVAKGDIVRLRQGIRHTYMP